MLGKKTECIPLKSNMAATWPEVGACKSENKRELCLQGHAISERIDKNGLDAGVYGLVNLNYLEISQTTLSSLQSGLGKLVNLTSLVLCNNQLEAVPAEIGKLEKLKTLNLSNNAIEVVPVELCTLSGLHTLNFNMNKLQEFPSIESMTYLHVFNVANNRLPALPEGIYNPEMVHLSHILAGNNEITEISEEIAELPHLNYLDLSNNKLTEAPAQLSICPRLKELNLKKNKFKDRRLAKLVEQPGAKPGINYLSDIMKKELQKSGKGDEKKKRKKKKGKKTDDVEEIRKNMITVLHFPSDTGVVIEVSPAVMSVRPYIVCCIVRDLDFKKSASKFKSFITLQTKLHDTVCQKRQGATIATHDYKAVKLPLRYDARFPQMLQIVPLFKTKAVSGEKLFDNLRKEAEELRKEKKRNTFSGIHKYLDLLKDKTQYPCLIDVDDEVISFPPITNSDKTKISEETRAILVEVTSTISLDTCKKVMDELLLKMLEMSLGAAQMESAVGGATGGASQSDSDDDGIVFEKKTVEKLTVEQVKIVDHEGNLRVVYPSRADLQCDAIKVIRNFD